LRAAWPQFLHIAEVKESYSGETNIGHLLPNRVLSSTKQNYLNGERAGVMPWTWALVLPVLFPMENTSALLSIYCTQGVEFDNDTEESL